MPVPRNNGKTAAVTKTETGNAGDREKTAKGEKVLLKISLDGNDDVKVESAFANLRIVEVKDALADLAVGFVNECHHRSSRETVAIREFMALFEAALIAADDDGTAREQMLANLKRNVGHFVSVLRRVN